MGKPKNKNKATDLDDDSDVEVVEQSEENKPAPKASKKDKKKKKKNDDWEDDIASELASLSVEANKGHKEESEEDDVVITKKEKKKKKKGKKEESEEEAEEDIEVVKNTGKKMASFNMLMMDDDDNDDVKSQSESDKEEETIKVERQETTKQNKKKEKKNKGKQKTAEEEDVDALLAELDKPKETKKSKKAKKKTEESIETEETESAQNGEVLEVEKVEPKVVTMEDLENEEEDDKKKRKKKKGKEKKDDVDDGEKDGEEGETTVKSAAQKKKEKKEREKLKKMADKKKQPQKKETPTEEQQGEKEDNTAEGETTNKEKEASDDEVDEEQDGKKKKKDKKKKGEKEEKEKKKKPKAMVAAILEAQKQLKEEEERLKAEEEERIRLEDEEIAAKIEKKRLDEERRLRKKEKEKERKDRLREEGKLLTAKQKQDQMRAKQLLDSMREQGIPVPQKDEIQKKRPVYGRKKKPQKTQDTEEKTPSPEVTPAQTPVTEESPSPIAIETEVKEEEEIKGEIKDDWELSSEEEEEKESSPEVETKIEIKEASQEEKKVFVKEEVVEESEEESDEDSDDGDDDSEEDDSESESESESDDDDLTPYDRAEIKLRKRHEKCEAGRSTDKLRAPVVCVLGHVDTGKTKILDKLRRTNVQDGEAGGITQQIGATNVPDSAIKEKTTMCKEFSKKEFKLPGLLIIDTPGHESFSNLRSRGSSLCDIAILVIDIMHGLEPQTIESIGLLKDRKTPFVVALNKIDRLYQWKSNPNSDVANTIKRQTPMCKQEFDERAQLAITQLAEQGLNSALFYENKNPKEYISLVPTSAHSGDGMGNMVALICELSQNWLAKKVSYTEELQATVMEVKAIHGLGTTIDVILVNGKLNEGDQIVIAGTEGPIVTQIRGLLMPQPMKELRVKGQYEHYKEVIAAQGVKIIGKDLEKSLAGLPLYVAHDEDEVAYYKEETEKALKDVLGSIKLSSSGVFVQASTLGSLEALLEFLRTSKIPYAGINIGPVHKRDIMRASVMLEHDPQWAVILAFDVKVEREAQEMADSLGVTIFTADIIYHLQDKFLKFREDLKLSKQNEFKNIAVFPCKIRVLPQFIFNSRDPIVMGVVVEAGIVKIGTPICVPTKEFVDLGRITSVEVNHKQQEMARKGAEVCIKIENIPGETPKLYGRHFDHTDLLVSKISRQSIDAVKNYFRDDMTKLDWTLMVELKKQFSII